MGAVWLSWSFPLHGHLKHDVCTRRGDGGKQVSPFYALLRAITPLTDLNSPCPQRVICLITLRHFPGTWALLPSIPFALMSINRNRSSSRSFAVMLTTCCVGSCCPFHLTCPYHCILHLVRYVSIRTTLARCLSCVFLELRPASIVTF